VTASSIAFDGEQVGRLVVGEVRTPLQRPTGGHRLGTLVKSAMLWMREQESALARLDTWNVESNNHMIGINEQLGYHIVTRAIDDQKNL
jgi:hypothetical protein